MYPTYAKPIAIPIFDEALRYPTARPGSLDETVTTLRDSGVNTLETTVNNENPIITNHNLPKHINSKANGTNATTNSNNGLSG